MLRAECRAPPLLHADTQVTAFWLSIASVAASRDIYLVVLSPQKKLTLGPHPHVSRPADEAGRRGARDTRAVPAGDRAETSTCTAVVQRDSSRWIQTTSSSRRSTSSSATARYAPSLLHPPAHFLYLPAMTWSSMPHSSVPRRILNVPWSPQSSFQLLATSQ